MERIGFVGGGAMAEALMRGLDLSRVIVSDKSEKRLLQLQKELKVSIVKENKEILKTADILVLAVKPQNLDEAVSSFAAGLTSDKLIISILAGVSTHNIEQLLPAGSRVVRAMPNTPALIGKGTTVLAAGKNASELDIETAKQIFSSVGSVEVLPEKMLNAVTGLSGSGPAYIYVFIEALADGGVMAGLPRDIAYKLAAETVRGAASMVLKTGNHPAQLKDMVTSPAGTTIYGLRELEKKGFRGIVMDTVMAGTERAEELVR